MFLQSIANIYYEKFGDKISELTFVFPNHRAGIFFRKYLSLAAGKSIMGPEITTIDSLFEKLAAALPHPLKKKESIHLLFDLFKIYQKINPQASLDEFIFWGRMLLNDFNEIDLYLVDAKKLFSNVSDLRDLSLLTEEEDKILREAFFNVFGAPDADAQTLNSPDADSILSKTPDAEETTSNTNVKKSFMHFWNQLYPMYEELRKQMLDEGYASNGFLHRQVIEQLDADAFKYRDKHFVFIGFNAINKAERELMKFMRDNMSPSGRVDFIWDYNLPAELQGNEALQYKAINLENFPMPTDLPLDQIPQAEYPEINLIDIASITGQTTVIRHFLNDVLSHSKSQHELYKTAVVLPDTTMLLPTLYAIPSLSKTPLPINVTMGYPISSAPVMALIKHIAQLHQTSRSSGGKTLFYHTPVLAILHAINTNSCIEEIISDIINKNKTYVDADYFINFRYKEKSTENTQNQDDLRETPYTDVQAKTKELLSTIFHTINTTDEAISYLDNLVTSLSHIFTDTLNQEPLTKLSEIIETLTPLKEQGMCENINTFFRILLELLNGMLLPFKGEPLQGLQIMGVLETRALDFDNIFIASVNEEVFPGKSSANSFIPNQLRKAFCMPLPEYKDGIFAYNFYRMIFHAKQVYLIHNTIADNITSGEVSRYVHQLTYLYSDKVNIHRKVAHLGQVVKSAEPAPFVINKTPEVLNKVTEYLKSGISPSAIKDYASCPLMFYLKHIMHMSESEMNDDMQNNELGTIVHQVMQWLYEGNDGTKDLDITPNARVKQTINTNNFIVTESRIDQYIAIVEKSDIMKRAYICTRLHDNNTNATHLLEGRELIYIDIAKRMTLAILRYEKQLAGKTTIHSPLCEVQACRKLKVNGIEVKLRGTIDHIDIIRMPNSKTEILRTTDYKTGEKNASFDGSDIEKLFTEPSGLNALQVLLYCYMLQQTDLLLSDKRYQPYLTSGAIQPHIYSAKEMLINKHEKVQTAFMPEGQVFNLLMPQFETELIKLLQKILDPETAFEKPENGSASCNYCAFKSVCGAKS